MQKSKKPTTSESNFIVSLLFLILSLCISLTVLIRYRPTRSFQVKIPERIAQTTKTELVSKAIQAHTEQAPKIETKAPQRSPSSELASKPAAASSVVASGDVKEAIQDAMRLINNNQLVEAKSLLEKLVANNPENDEVLTQLALINLLDFKDEESAQPLFEKALALNPNNKTALAELVEIYADRGDESGVKNLQSLYEKNPDNNNLALGIGQVLIESNPKAAIPYLEKGGEKALTDLGEAYSLAGDYPKALETHLRQEESITSKLQSGSGGDFLQEELLQVRINIIGDLVATGDQNQGLKKLEEIKSKLRPEEYQSILDRLGLRTSSAGTDSKKVLS